MYEFTDHSDEQADNNTEHPALDNSQDKAVKTGTTTVGITASNGVAVATDRQATVGHHMKMVDSKSVNKIQQVHPTAVMTMCGLVSAAQQFAQDVEKTASLYEARRGEQMRVPALARKIAANLHKRPRRINPILAGVDEEGSHVYGMGPAGSVIPDAYKVTGSGTQYAYGVLEDGFEADLGLDDAQKLAVSAVEAAAGRDASTGYGVTLARITTDGVTMDTFKNYADAEPL